MMLLLLLLLQRFDDDSAAGLWPGRYPHHLIRAWHHRLHLSRLAGIGPEMPL